MLLRKVRKTGNRFLISDTLSLLFFVRDLQLGRRVLVSRDERIERIKGDE